MERLAAKRDEQPSRGEEPAAPAPVVPGSLQWASAVGNAAVQRLARQEAEVAEAEPEVEAVAPEEAAEEAAPPEVEAMEQAGIGPEAVAGLEAVDELGEDALPE